MDEGGGVPGRAEASVPRILGRDPLPGGWVRGGPPQVWLLRIADHAPEPPEVYERILDADERGRATAFFRDLHRERYTAAHLGLRRLLGAYLGTGPADVALIREPCPGCGKPHGRPAVAGAPLHFNLSHAGDLAFFAFADTPVGADVEEEQPAEVVDGVVRMLHPDETAEIGALPGPDRAAAFARCWTRKEAYLKGTGTGLSESPAVTYVGSGAAPVSPPGWTLTDVAVGAGHAAAIAVATA
ncbi:4'-phosphopantetheinyl transferase family protein [Streptomyces albireticuli]|uniref:4-phosphopantetheinyl transferase n=1 Tax=Streptomyces albireticuli TaxID=1940 RepID=A0A2A2DCA3_9ACTN|nr:4'-phosphopantetheinyl transferase superfamily protein [Streptomyces albireticuli]MCD9140818.1 4'-phosphopantetheinyl transferase superfamily protein [Streptomyces albireticuli]MCD9161220.1 4'-phosphopantetheinyl transferase superfamily protein [Streptomyces albireticuli]MCD9190722.1 4'-phosphopantetheinyl transferase superfamily protein [Streptomyces albireticuli]PAU48980.1 4-phosphopantetheinyl transferase [Streptomyces albireticuli]